MEGDEIDFSGIDEVGRSLIRYYSSDFDVRSEESTTRRDLLLEMPYRLRTHGAALGLVLSYRNVTERVCSCVLLPLQAFFDHLCSSTPTIVESKFCSKSPAVKIFLFPRGGGSRLQGTTVVHSRAYVPHEAVIQQPHDQIKFW